MKRFVVAVCLLLSPPVMAQQTAQQTAPLIPFNSVPNALKLPPDLYMGEAAGVAVNSKGHIFVFHRGGSSHGPAFANTAAQLWEFDPDGQFHPRDRQESLCLVVRPCRAHRQGRQYLGDRQGLGHDHQVQPGGPRHHGDRTQAGSVRRRHQAA